MQYRFSNLWLRLAAFLLAAVCVGLVFFHGMIGVACVSLGCYDGDPVYQETWQCGDLVRTRGREIIDQFRHNPEFTQWSKLLGQSDLRFIILEEATGDVKAAYLDGLAIETPKNMKDNIWMERYDGRMDKGGYGTVLENVYVCDYYFGMNWEWENSWEFMVNDMEAQAQQAASGPVEIPMAADVEEDVSYQILYLLGTALSGKDSIGDGYRVFLYFKSMKDRILVPLCAGAAALVLLTIFLLVQTGRRPGQTELQTTWVERVPTDLLLVVGAGAALGLVFLVGILENRMDYALQGWSDLQELALWQGVTSAAAAACGLVGLLVLCSCILRLKQKCFLRSALIIRAVRWCWQKGKKLIICLWQQLVLVIRSIGMVPRAVAVFLAVLLVEILLITWLVNAWNPAFPLMALTVFNCGLLAALIWGVAQMKILQNAAGSLAEGDLEQQLELGRMYWDFKRHGENLNAIASGMNKAVEQRLRSERLKAELITNVSHDIKTPLTSIVNYVDLLQKPHTEAEGIQYLEVLDRQSRRLKKLTENLVEASKASAGVLAVDLQPTRLRELLNQALEEYRDRLAAGKLEPVLDLQGDLTVMADGKHMWRILDNLLNNVVKYAMSGTRVYITARKHQERVLIAVKNISRDPLNVDAEELMERFVRGDSSRHTEGSGLGLNIARSLTTLQHGTFELTVDGDFFKAEISLPVV